MSHPNSKPNPGSKPTKEQPVNRHLISDMYKDRNWGCFKSDGTPWTPRIANADQKDMKTPDVTEPRIPGQSMYWNVGPDRIEPPLKQKDLPKAAMLWVGPNGKPMPEDYQYPYALTQDYYGRDHAQPDEAAASNGVDDAKSTASSSPYWRRR